MKQRILVIDDNPINLKLALCVLEMEGYLVDQAADAEQALAFLRDTVPDLIFVDISLPGMDGLTLTRKLKAEDRFKHVPIVALTAYAMKGDRERALDAGCDGYIAKPIDTRAFAAQAAVYLQRAVTG
jgi:Response regulators consisting of a CheY-like receiver domain and a winged-helix DNA-binding domain